MEFTKFRDPTKLRSKDNDGSTDLKTGKGKWKKQKKRFKTSSSMSQTNGSNSKKPANSTEKKTKKNERHPKLVQESNVVKTRTALPSNPTDFSANWRQISNLIQKQAIQTAVPEKDNFERQNAKKEKIGLQDASSNPTTFDNSTVASKSKLKRKLKKEKAKLGKKNGIRKPDAKKRKKADKEDVEEKGKTEQINRKDKSEVSKPTKSSQSSGKKKFWFEVDNIHLDRVVNAGGEAVTAIEEHLVKPNAPTGLTPAIAIDCEMVGVGVSKRSALARVSIVNQFGHCIYDKYVKPEEEITDYRTFVSGIRPRDLVNGDHIDIVRQEVADIFRGRIVVAHGIHNDLKALFLRHPKRDIRDTSHYFKRHFSGHTPSLKRLTETLLNLKVQSGEHSSVEDAQATMRLYTMYKKEWEASLGSRSKVVASSLKEV